MRRNIQHTSSEKECTDRMFGRRENRLRVEERVAREKLSVDLQDR